MKRALNALMLQMQSIVLLGCLFKKRMDNISRPTVSTVIPSVIILIIIRNYHN